MLFLSMNKQLDLQTLITDTGRWIAVNIDLMEERHIFKICFIFIMLTSILTVAFKYRKGIFKFSKLFETTVIG